MMDQIKLTRRRMLKQTFAFSAAAMMGRTLTTEAQVLPLLQESMHLMMIGDWGAKEPKAQKAVAKGMIKFLEKESIKPEAMLLLGDNFYGSLKGGVKSSRWKEQFSEMYPRTHFNCPCYAVLGNHDYRDDSPRSREAQLSYAEENPGTRWTMPDRWYAFDLAVNSKPLVRVVAVDTNWKDMGEKRVKKQNDWLKEELARPRSTPWLFVMGHHPLYSNGKHGDTDDLIDEWGPLFKKHQVNFYFCGHDHDLQHMEFEKLPTSFVLSGGGGARIREIEEMKHGPYAKAIYGFTHLQITPEQITVQHVDANRKRLHAFTKSLDGSVRIAES